MEFADHIGTPKLDGVILHSPFHEPVDGTLCVSGHHLILSSRKEDVEELWLLHQCIDSVEKRPNGTNSNNQNGGSLILKCKDLRILQLDIATTEEFLNVYASIERLSNLDNASNLYPFFFRPMYSILEDGHTLFKPELEFSKLLASDEWRITNVNKNYYVCPTYSSTIIVPKSIDDETIMAAANFRDGGRFPVLSYRHDNGAVLMRSSQPLLNNCNRRCRADEKILNQVLGMNKKGYIIDTRSNNLTSHCKAKGGGTEPEGHYTQWRRTHRGLDKIANCTGALLDCFQKFMDACNDTGCSPDKWVSRVERSNWLSHVQNALNAACLVAQCLDQEGASVLVHGSSGLDSTLLVTSIAQVILNPDCRTVRGLQALIEREWLQAGHPFQMRHGKFCYSNARNKNQQPTFLLFLDCVQQLHYQFPCSFEFTTQMLIILFEHSYASQFGTFLGNCDREREKLEVAKGTTSLWSYLNRPNILTSILNPLYEPNKTAIWPSVAPVSLNLWTEFYHRWIVDQSQYKKAMTKMHGLIENDKNVRSKVVKYRKQLADLQKEYDNFLDENDGSESG
ncbi:PREDICTED: myotubularin-related protein 9 [Nicrophorus vespilloides]|uniref:Myotubularin-related protein 9 n=1 Tax=Nicrophorus vespilloides TaxID=110193 RepID=A0ABM1NG08_NICVS|nr:PREDICTED: myotubularin-related protein 9 [Nicrophorus vespilloides]